jgi:hypothetical protein
MVSTSSFRLTSKSDNGIDQGVMGGLLTLGSFLRYFPEIDTVNPPTGSSTSHAATIQAITGELLIPHTIHTNSKSLKLAHTLSVASSEP